MTAQSPAMDWSKKAAALQFESKAFIDGDYQQASGNDYFETENPATQTPLAMINDGGAAVIDKAVSAAREAFKQSWQWLPPDQRKTLLYAFAAQIDLHRETLALFDSLEMGMPIAMALEQVDGAAYILRYNAELIDKVYGEVAPADSANLLAISAREPRGVVGIISPWNFPVATAICSIAPALAAGNTLVIKPSEQTPSSILKLAELSIEAGLPAGVFNVVPGLGATTGKALANHRDVDLLSFTGSVNVGRQLMVDAGQSNGKPVVLELGGKSPQIVFEDAADIDGLGAALTQSAFYNSGQLCVAKTRLLVHENVKASVIDAIKTAMPNTFTVGDPLNETTNFGPMASKKHYQRVKQYLTLGQQEGAALHALNLVGTLPDTGYFISPVLFDDVDNDSRIAQEEIFGPVLSVITFTTEEEAIHLANAVDFGLSASVWTKDLGCARRLARDLQSGDISIHSTTTPATPSAALSGEPFGASGHGVLGGRRGLDIYTRCKSVQWITE